MSDTIILSNGKEAKVPTGCQDIPLFRRIQEAKLNPAKRKAAKSRRQPTSRSKRSAYAKMQAAIGLATLVLVERVNRETIPFNGEPGEGTEGLSGRDYYGE